MDPASASSLALIGVVAVLAPLFADGIKRWVRVPGVVLEIALGIVIGPQVLGLAEVTDIVSVFGNLGLTFLMFLAGFEIDLDRIKGRPLTRATQVWFVSLALAVVVAGILVLDGFVHEDLLVALALTTTALGTLLPMLSDAKVLDSPFGAQVLSVGSVGEFLPIVAIALLLTTDNPGRTAVFLVAFVLLAVGVTLLATRARTPRVVELMRRHVDSSAQLPVRIAVLMMVGLVWVAGHLGLDVLLGAFAAGIIVRLFTEGEHEAVVASKLQAIGFGFLVPIFFVVSGMNFDLDALFAEPTTILRVPLFLALFLVVRGLPTLVGYRRDLIVSERRALAFFASTALPLVVVITGIGLDTGRMAPENAAALVGAGMVSVLVFPLVGFAFHRRASDDTGVDAGVDAGGVEAETGFATVEPGTSGRRAEPA